MAAKRGRKAVWGGKLFGEESCLGRKDLNKKLIWKIPNKF